MQNMAYFAGIIDGEGNVGVYSNGQRDNCLAPEICVKMTNEEVIDLLIATFGGAKRFRRRQEDHWQDQWVWRVKFKKALACAQAIRPYVVVKRDALDAIIGHYGEPRA